MICIITGDIINSKKTKARLWLTVLKKELGKVGTCPKHWDIFRGDSFQVAIKNPQDGLLVALKIKAALKSLKNIDVRMAIGIGNKTFNAPNIRESNGSAFVHSGEKYELLKKEKQTLAIKSEWEVFDKEINLYLKLGLIAIDNWTINAAEIVKTTMGNPNKSQEEIGKILGIKQNAVSRRLKRAYYAEIIELNEMYVSKLKELL